MQGEWWQAGHWEVGGITGDYSLSLLLAAELLGESVSAMEINTQHAKDKQSGLVE